MREIKFRVWDIENKEFRDDEHFINPNGDLIVFGFNGGFVLDMDYYRVEQFTGLKDKNGKEIYEHDVINFDWRLQATSELYADDCENIKGVVKFQNGKYVVRFFNDSMSFDLSDVNQSTFERFWRETYVSAKDDYFKMTGFEVVGNIHENPELLDNAK